MLTRLNHIRKFGVFDDFKHVKTLPDFGDYNLFYGWNYSGKTTLSRFFQQLEDRHICRLFPTSQFSLTFTTGNVDQDNVSNHSNIVRVFNTDFVKKNLNFAGEPFNPVLLLGEQHKKDQRSLERAHTIANRLEKQTRELETALTDTTKDLASLRQQYAKQIKSALQLVTTYTATHLQQDIQATSNESIKSTLTTENLHALRDVATTRPSDQPSPVSPIASPISVSDLFTRSIPLLSASPVLTNTIKHLQENPAVANWIESGLAIHEPDKDCKFCGSPIPQSRIDAFRSHFSDDLAALRSDVREALTIAESAGIQPTFAPSSSIAPTLRLEYEKSVSSLETLHSQYQLYTSNLVSCLKHKLENPFTILNTPDPPPTLDKQITEAIRQLNDIVDSHNSICDNFAQEQQQALRSCRLHYAYEYASEGPLPLHEERIARLQTTIRSKQSLLQIVNQVRDALTARLHSSEEGRQELNALLVALLGTDRLSVGIVKIDDQERFQLQRSGGIPAENLSDGEATAVAFAYFLTKLQELRSNFTNTIVFIDDPISSLDSNHVFQVTALIKNMFFEQSHDDKWRTKCLQLFVSTHNFQFFDLLRELPKQKIKQTFRRMYMTRRVSESSSQITPIPKTIANNRSEYEFLFSAIYKFSNDGYSAADENIAMIPNAVRRFVELYSCSRLPGTPTVDKRVELLFGPFSAKRILKVLHYFSHGNSIDRLSSNNELMCDIAPAIDELLGHIQTKDRLHWDSLIQSVDTST
ncbi:MAG: AAA family ATPase [Rubinisphaera brasiliensis]|uniref:AAA family ATPase n=1 Tax=Rubinisphaera brasiliensis TaxID=119 RepID=UPI00391A9EE5